MCACTPMDRRRHACLTCPYLEMQAGGGGGEECSSPRAGCISARSTHQNVEAVGRRKAIVGCEAGRNPGQWRFAQEHFAFRQCPRRSHAQALAWHGADADGAIIPAIAASVTAPGARSGQPCGTRNGLTPLKLLRDDDRNGPQESCHRASCLAAANLICHSVPTGVR